MQYTYKSRKAARQSQKHWNTRAKTKLVTNKRKSGNTYTLKIKLPKDK